MKYPVQIFGLCILTLILIGCSANAPQEPIDTYPEPIDMVPDNSDEEIGEPIIEEEYSLTTENGNTLIIDNFGEMIAVSSPLTITGKAPRKWYFEGIFPISLQTLNGDEIITVGATGPWLESVDGNENLEGDDMIEFSATLEFSAPLGMTEGKLIFRSDNPSGEEEFDDSAEVQVQFQ